MCSRTPNAAAIPQHEFIFYEFFIFFEFRRLVNRVVRFYESPASPNAGIKGCVEELVTVDDSLREVAAKHFQMIS